MTQARRITERSGASRLDSRGSKSGRLKTGLHESLSGSDSLVIVYIKNNSVKQAKRTGAHQESASERMASVSKRGGFGHPSGFLSNKLVYPFVTWPLSQLFPTQVPWTKHLCMISVTKVRNSLEFQSPVAGRRSESEESSNLLPVEWPKFL